MRTGRADALRSGSPRRSRRPTVEEGDREGQSLLRWLMDEHAAQRRGRGGERPGGRRTWNLSMSTLDRSFSTGTACFLAHATVMRGSM